MNELLCVAVGMCTVHIRQRTFEWSRFICGALHKPPPPCCIRVRNITMCHIVLVEYNNVICVVCTVLLIYWPYVVYSLSIFGQRKHQMTNNAETAGRNEPQQKKNPNKIEAHQTIKPICCIIKYG